MKKWTKMLLTLGLVTTSTICFPLVAASCTKTTDSNSNNQNIDKNNDNKPNEKKPESLKNEDSSANNENQNVQDNKEKELYELFDFERNSSNNWKITNYNGKQIDVVIPSYFKGTKVEEIDENASFENCKIKFDNGFDKITKDLTKGLKKIASVTIPENVKSIENEAFKNFKNLKELTLKNGIENIGEGAFEGTQISSISILPSSIKEIKAKTFKDCWYLKKIDFSNGIERIGENAFEDAGVTSIIFPNSLKDVYANAFYYCDNLKELTLNEGLNSIGEGAFEGTGVTTIIFPNSLKDVYANAFYYCDNLKELTLNEGLNSIGSQAFLGTKISSVTIPSSVTQLSSKDIFNKDCEITLRNGFEKINRNITGVLQYQKSITIPASVKEIEEGAFKDFKNLKEVVLNEGIERIGKNAFKNRNLEVVTIPNSVKEIGTNAFLAGFKYYDWNPFFPSLKEVYYKGNKNNTPWNWNDIGIDIKIVKEI
ncbi:leucine-rich repeat protein [Metamycoplasma hominis]|uniref:leucine-rich repeat domain-containing protein n=1 Tax=Metamycoplasma hominis TaxID=2098 RepID=UPI00158A6808|nr:leucine-rich repeat protein [Metamycoplasma hominis]QKX31640.1 leucine-rich repeat protein [Metamycoplasma hominis]